MDDETNGRVFFVEEDIAIQKQEEAKKNKLSRVICCGQEFTTIETIRAHLNDHLNG